MRDLASALKEESFTTKIGIEMLSAGEIRSLSSAFKDVPFEISEKTLVSEKISKDMLLILNSLGIDKKYYDNIAVQYNTPLELKRRVEYIHERMNGFEEAARSRLSSEWKMSRELYLKIILTYLSYSDMEFPSTFQEISDFTSFSRTLMEVESDEIKASKYINYEKAAEKYIKVLERASDPLGGEEYKRYIDELKGKIGIIERFLRDELDLPPKKWTQRRV